MEFVWIILGGFLLFFIIANAVKMAVKEALREFKDEIVEEFNLKSIQKKGEDSTED